MADANLSSRAPNFKDLTGERFGKLVVKSKAGRSWHCVCDCGGTRKAGTNLLVSGGVKSCGCLKRPNLVGQRFGKLLVVSSAGSIKKKSGADSAWECMCDCGNTIVRRGSVLRLSGPWTSCGCSRKWNRRHGMTGTQVYCTWVRIIGRCYNKKNNSYKDYGGRGIRVCPRWRSSFEKFCEDMGDRPSALHSIERKNNSLGYCPSNCCWALKKQQARNTRTNRFLTFGGHTKCIAEWAEEIGIEPRNIYARIAAGWSVEKTLTTPKAKRYL